MENGFTHIQCTLCGLSVSARNYDPTNFRNDIDGIRFKGLGYAKGFGVAARGSILQSGDPVIELIAYRIIVISRFLMDAGIITDNMLASHFPVLESNISAKAKLESEVDALEVDVEELERKNAGLRNKVAKLESEVDALEVDVEDLENKNAGLKNKVEEQREQLERRAQDEGYVEAESETDKNGGAIAKITNMVEEVIGDEFYARFNGDENAGENLKQMISYLLNEYEALVE